MKLRSKLIKAAADWITADIGTPVPVHPETGDATLEPPYAVVRISPAEPLAPGEPVWNLTLIVAVHHHADLTPAMDAEQAAEQTFAAVDFQPREGESNEDAELRFAAFASFCEAQGVAVSAMFPLDSEMSADDGRWIHLIGFQVIASEI